MAHFINESIYAIRLTIGRVASYLYISHRSVGWTAAGRGLLEGCLWLKWVQTSSREQPKVYQPNGVKVLVKWYKDSRLTRACLVFETFV